MTNTGNKSFDLTVQKTNEWLNNIKEELQWESKDDVYIATKAVLQTLRDRLPIDEAIHLAEQLPMLMKGMYYEGYKPRGKPEKMSENGFYRTINDRIVNKEIDPESAAKAIIKIIYLKIGKGEFDDIKSNMPSDIQTMIAEAGV
ncbi:MAG: DUF2267 domain-containing protein [Candidatus Woesearchaeota archaeon]